MIRLRLSIVGLMVLTLSSCGSLLSKEEMLNRCGLYKQDTNKVTVTKMGVNGPFKCLVTEEGDLLGRTHWIPSEEDIEKAKANNE